MTLNKCVQLTKNMKLVLLIWSLHISITNAHDDLQQLTEQAMSLPEFQPQPPINPFILDNQLYLPPEPQTQQPLPYFSSSPEPKIKYLPANDIKIPNPYPQPFERFKEFNAKNLHFGPEHRPSFQDTVSSTDQTPITFIGNQKNQNNFSRNSPGPQNQWEKNEQIAKSRSIQIMNQPIHNNRKEYGTMLPIHQNYQNPGVMPPINFNRRTLNQQVPQQFQHNNIIDTLPDQFKTASSVSQQHVSPPQHYQGPPTEAVPILRQSSEMDLDGSFQYETLTGDQTHIVQHGHMENAGTENEEQVIEGSYSFVGDDGQTYTVHYVADGNGFRATGDHLPVAPPIPEIIQRSIQYNINEEAHRPPPQSQYGYHDGDNNELHKNQQAPIQRAFFQSKPEAFTRSPQTLSTQNSVAQASNIYQQVLKDNTPRSFVQPQVNYAASQGAYIPVSNNVQSTARSYVPTPTDAPKTYAPSQNIQTQAGRSYNMPLHTEVEALNSSWQLQKMFMPASESQNGRSYDTSNKNGISRSSTDEEDEVLINFNDMTPNQYAQIYQSQIAPRTVEISHKTDTDKVVDQNYNLSRKNPLDIQIKSNLHPQIITGKSYLPPSQTVTSSYVYVPKNYDHENTRYQASNQISLNQVPQNQVIKSAKIVKPLEVSRIHNRNNINYFQTQNIQKDFPAQTLNYKQPYEDIITADNLAMESYNIPEIKPPLNMKPEQNSLQKLHYNNNQFTMISSVRNDMPNHLSEVLTPPLEIPKYYHHEDNRKYVNNDTASQNNILFFYDNKNNETYNMQQHKFSNIKEEQILNSALKQGNKQIQQTTTNNNKPSSPDERRVKSQKYESNKNMMLENSEKSYISNTQNENDESPVDLSHILNLVNMKNYFESSRTKPRTHQQLQTPSVHKQIRNIVLQNPNKYMEENKAIDPNVFETHLKYFESPESANTQKYSYATANPNRADKNKQNGGRVYKTLQRNLSKDTQTNGNSPFVQNPRMVPFEQTNSPLHNGDNQHFTNSLPLLGRAGPSTKTYIPPQAPLFS